jgi:hypothetical protein
LYILHKLTYTLANPYSYITDRSTLAPVLPRRLSHICFFVPHHHPTNRSQASSSFRTPASILHFTEIQNTTELHMCGNIGLDVMYACTRGGSRVRRKMAGWVRHVWVRGAWHRVLRSTSLESHHRSEGVSCTLDEKRPPFETKFISIFHFY